MFDQFLPKSLDNRYRGHRLGIWLFGVVVFVKLAQSLAVIFNGASVITSADGVPLATYPPASAQTVVAVWALSGLYRLVFATLCVLACVRYRAAIPLLFALLALEHVGRQLVLHFLPVVRAGSPPGPIVHLVLFVLTILGLALSLWNRGDRRVGG
ncbi:MAG TPA: hypothetical protein VGM13_14985 [Thermoanaerobaculia bacterium]|jgi:hypothetical protein